MKAVYQCNKKYFCLSREMVLNHYTVRSTGGRVRDCRFTEREVYKPPEVVGTGFYVENDFKPLPSFKFWEGEKHNQLTLTEPMEIAAMRAFIRRRGLPVGDEPCFVEISFEGDETELEAVKLPVKAPETVERKIYSSKSEERRKRPETDEDGLSEFDLSILSNMRQHNKIK